MRKIYENQLKREVEGALYKMTTLYVYGCLVISYVRTDILHFEVSLEIVI